MPVERRRIAVVLKGYPRLSETFIAQELLGLEQAGLELVLVSLRRPTDKKRHPVHDEIRAPVHYLPEYLHEEPRRVASALLRLVFTGGFWRALVPFLSDLSRDRSRNRLRRFGQALVLAAEWPGSPGWLHAHFIHTPASVTRYASLLSGVPWTCSAHAKDIWTSPNWELAGKLASARWTVTCTRAGFDHLRSLAADPASVHLSHHGLDLSRFGPPQAPRPSRDGSSPADPVTLLSVGRAVEKKGYPVLLRALARLPADLAWRFRHIGGGESLEGLQALSRELGIDGRVEWMGAQAQTAVLRAYRAADLFALACRVADDGDRDGLPNVLVEAASQGLCCVSTNVSGVPELLQDGRDGLLVPPDDPQALAGALERAMRDPDLRRRLGDAAETRVRGHFDYRASIAYLKNLFERSWSASP